MRDFRTIVRSYFRGAAKTWWQMMPAAFHVAALDLQLSRTGTSRKVAVSLLSRVNTTFCD